MIEKNQIINDNKRNNSIEIKIVRNVKEVSRNSLWIKKIT